MKDGKGEVGLASFNNPLASLNAELETLRKVLDISPDVLITQHYGTIEGQNEIERHIKQALDEGHYLKSKTLEVLSEAGGKGVEFKRLTKKVIDFPKYLSGIATRTNSMWVILKEYIDEGLVERIQGSSRFRVA